MTKLDRTRDELLDDFFHDRMTFSETKEALSSGILLEDDIHEKNQRKQLSQTQSTLQEKWEKLRENDSETDRFVQIREIMAHDSPEFHEHFVEEFELWVEQGLYPPPEVIFSLYKCLKDYLTAAGKKSLDMAIFGNEHTKRQSFAFKKRHFGWDQQFGAFHAFVLQEKDLAEEEGRRPKLIKTLAYEFLEPEINHRKRAGLKELSLDSFEVRYRAWKREELPRLEQ